MSTHHTHTTKIETAKHATRTAKRSLIDWSTIIRPHEKRLLIGLLILVSVFLNIYFIGVYMMHRYYDDDAVWHMGKQEHAERGMHMFGRNHDDANMQDTPTHAEQFSFVYCENGDCKRYDKNGEQQISKAEAQKLHEQMTEEFTHTQKEIQRHFDEMEQWHKKLMRDMWAW